MTALDSSTASSPVPSHAERARDVLLSEWTKARSVRSTYWILLVAAVTAVGGSALVATTTARSGHSPFDPLASVFVAWLEYPVLAVGILGALAFSSEYSTGQIRTTFTAVPQRRAVLAAKATTVGPLMTLCDRSSPTSPRSGSVWVATRRVVLSPRRGERTPTTSRRSSCGRSHGLPFPGRRALHRGRSDRGRERRAHRCRRPSARRLLLPRHALQRLRRAGVG